LVAVDYVAKWVEGLASPTNDYRVIARLFKKIIFTHFGVREVLIGHNGAHFIKKKLGAMLRKYGMHHKHGLGYDP